jgi:radical SAM superfamily enzyme YgiQ (UPF0313 family)
MRTRDIYYKEPVFRPPSEAYSLLIQATEGCTYRCSFCVSNLGKPFKIRKAEEIIKDLDIAREIYGNRIQKIFFLDGNALVMPFKELYEITAYAKKIFPNLDRVSVYAHANDILHKTDEELKQLSDIGLKMVYIGIETGNNELLKRIGKHSSSDDIVAAFHKCFKANITPSGTIILGLAGNDKDLSTLHAKDTSILINRASPHNLKDLFPHQENLPIWYISALTLMIPPGTPIYKETIENKFHPMNPDEILQEMKIFIENISDDVKNCIFRSNHASNYLAIKGTLAEDKSSILKLIEKNLRDHEDLRPEFYRGL